MFTARTLLEGKWPILVLAALSVAGLLWCWLAAAISLALLAFTISFFRDPTPNVPADPRAIVSPADGTVSDIVTMHEPNFLNTEAKRIGIFLSIFDVHVQRAPVEGRVKLVKYCPGKFVDARRPECATMNENRIIGLETPAGVGMTVRQIAGLIARRIVGWADEGATLAKGDRIGMIRFGSRVELFLPVTAQIVIELGQHVKGGETIVARI
jgi:phosphatidylserine decarboxylase